MVSIGNPFNVYRAATELNHIKNFIYGKFSTIALIDRVKLNIDIIKEKNEKFDLGIDFKKIYSANTTFEFD